MTAEAQNGAAADVNRDVAVVPTLRNFTWNAKRRAAAMHVAEGELTDQQIADAAGISRMQLYNWRQHPDFAARVKDHESKLASLAERFSIGRRLNRLKSQNDRWTRLQQVIADRASAEWYQDAPGGKTGLMARTVKSIGSGDNAKEVVEHSVDTGLLKELRELETLAAKELGQWIDRHDHTTKDAPITIVEFHALPELKSASETDVE